MDLIAWIDSRCILPNVGLRSLCVPFGSWKIQGYSCPASWRYGLCPCNVVLETNLYRAALHSLGVLWALFRECGLFVQWKSYRSPSMGFGRRLCATVGWGGVFNANQVGSQGRLGLVSNLDSVGVELSSYWLIDVLYVGQRPPNGGRCVLRFLLNDPIKWHSRCSMIGLNNSCSYLVTNAHYRLHIHDYVHLK